MSSAKKDDRWKALNTPWEMFGVFMIGAYENAPLAIFREEHDAEAFAATCVVTVSVRSCRKVRGITWASDAPVPPSAGTPTLNEL